MSAIVINPAELADALKREAWKGRRALELASRAAAFRLVGELMALTDELGITDTGVYKAAFQVVEYTGLMNPVSLGPTPPETYAVVNISPHAGIVELGARPHYVSEEGRQGIKAWCIRKLKLTEEEAEQASWAIVHKIAEVGQEGRFVMRDKVPRARELLRMELERILARMAGQGSAP